MNIHINIEKSKQLADEVSAFMAEMNISSEDITLPVGYSGELDKGWNNSKVKSPQDVMRKVMAQSVSESHAKHKKAVNAAEAAERKKANLQEAVRKAREKRASTPEAIAVSASLAAAKQNGEKTYLGRDCIKCGSKVRYVISSNCVDCAKKRKEKYNPVRKPCVTTIGDAEVQMLDEWVKARPGRLLALSLAAKTSSAAIYHVRFGSRGCSVKRFERFKQAMEIVEQQEKLRDITEKYTGEAA